MVLQCGSHGALVEDANTVALLGIVSGGRVLALGPVCRVGPRLDECLQTHDI